ncbi:hypothetical protein VV02_23985 [Luteipulveratus mongoliensis]|uniref:Replication-relaxation n=1 Tax=Luteipulveratus mongoliensis TaxID=571913 RepID=A0A0K1JRB3_9MICO|nr:hypothetical protein VV02_23985 [Luteipulveratus mongoliensis]
MLEHRFQTSRQIAQFHFADHANVATSERVARRALARLEREQLIRAVDGRRVGGLTAGSAISTWHLTGAGYRVLTGRSDRYRRHDPTTRFLKHTLAIADAHLIVLAVARNMHATADVAIEGAASRNYPGLGGERQQLQPDLAAVIRGQDTEGVFEDRWFIEVDLGTESIPTLVAKCEAYETYRRSGLEQADTGGSFPLVLWIFDSERAASRVLALTGRVHRLGRLDPLLFRFATAESLQQTLSTGGAL